MSKAYERVKWDFILRALSTYGFPGYWIQLINQCISTVTYKDLINGHTSNHFRPNCGIRQGDPLSPYLFLFYMDILSRMLQLGTDIGQFKGINIIRGSMSISILFFADDALLFFKAATSCQNIKDIVSRFCDISGQELNLSKTHFKLSLDV